MLQKQVTVNGDPPRASNFSVWGGARGSGDRLKPALRTSWVRRSNVSRLTSISRRLPVLPRFGSAEIDFFGRIIPNGLIAPVGAGRVGHFVAKLEQFADCFRSKPGLQINQAAVVHAGTGWFRRPDVLDA